MIPTKEYGFEDGSICDRKGCVGIITSHEKRPCSCHTSPPCSACVEPRAYCPICDWQERDELVINDYVVQVDRATGVYKSWERRPLDRTKIDWYSDGHTHFSMIKEGVYPEGTTMAQVLEEVKGTFGGRFEHFGNGTFKYIAYTD